MLEYLKGKIYVINEFEIIIDINSFGFKALTPSKFNNGEECQVFTKVFIKEEELKMFAFKSKEERELFLKLLNISGVGEKQSLRLLKEFSLKELIEIINNKNISKLTKVQGIGKKLAQRIIFELSGKLDFKSEEDNLEKDIIEALEEFGYKKTEIKKAIQKIELGKFSSIEEIIKEILKILSAK